MSTARHSVTLNAALSEIPKNLRERLVRHYSDLKAAVLQNKPDVVGLNGGKLAEVMIRVLQHRLTGHHTPLNKSLGRFNGECDALAKTPKESGPESARLIIPKALLFLYTLRNKRDIGHAGGFNPFIADAFEKADNGRGGASCQKEEITQQSLNVKRLPWRISPA